MTKKIGIHYWVALAAVLFGSLKAQIGDTAGFGRGKIDVRYSGKDQLVVTTQFIFAAEIDATFTISAGDSVIKTFTGQLEDFLIVDLPTDTELTLRNQGTFRDLSSGDTIAFDVETTGLLGPIEGIVSKDVFPDNRLVWTGERNLHRRVRIREGVTLVCEPGSIIQSNDPNSSLTQADLDIDGGNLEANGAFFLNLSEFDFNGINVDTDPTATFENCRLANFRGATRTRFTDYDFDLGNLKEGDIFAYDVEAFTTQAEFDGFAAKPFTLVFLADPSGRISTKAFGPDGEELFNEGPENGRVSQINTITSLANDEILEPSEIASLINRTVFIQFRQSRAELIHDQLDFTFSSDDRPRDLVLFGLCLPKAKFLFLLDDGFALKLESSKFSGLHARPRNRPNNDNLTILSEIFISGNEVTAALPDFDDGGITIDQIGSTSPSVISFNEGNPAAENPERYPLKIISTGQAAGTDKYTVFSNSEISTLSIGTPLNGPANAVTADDNKCSSVEIFGKNNIVKENEIGSNEGFPALSGVRVGRQDAFSGDEQSSDNAVIDNTILNRDVGISLGHASNNTIERNRVLNCFFGLSFGGNAANTSPTNNTIKDNEFRTTGDGSANLKLNGVCAQSVCANSFSEASVIDGENILGGTKLGGNFWSEFRGDDVNQDGIGDTEFVIATAADGSTYLDPFPLAQPSIIVVNISTDEDDADLSDGLPDVDLTTDGLQTSLRAAIQTANAESGVETIVFLPNLPEIVVEQNGSIVITEAVNVDGLGNGRGDKMSVRQGVAATVALFKVEAEEVTFQGLDITGNGTQNGFELRDAGRFTMENCKLLEAGVTAEKSELGDFSDLVWHQSPFFLDDCEGWNFAQCQLDDSLPELEHQGVVIIFNGDETTGCLVKDSQLNTVEFRNGASDNQISEEVRGGGTVRFVIGGELSKTAVFIEQGCSGNRLKEMEFLEVVEPIALGPGIEEAAGNLGQPAPVINSLYADDTTLERATILASLQAMPNASYLIEVYVQEETNPLSEEEIRRTLAPRLEQIVTTGGDGLAEFSIPVAANELNGAVGLTATDENGNTSELSILFNHYRVNSDEDLEDADLSDGFARDGSGLTTLRAALAQGEDLAAFTRVDFNLDGTSSDIIRTNSQLPIIELSEFEILGKIRPEVSGPIIHAPLFGIGDPLALVTFAPLLLREVEFGLFETAVTIAPGGEGSRIEGCSFISNTKSAVEVLTGGCFIGEAVKDDGSRVFSEFSSNEDISIKIEEDAGISPGDFEPNVIAGCRFGLGASDESAQVGISAMNFPSGVTIGQAGAGGKNTFENLLTAIDLSPNSIEKLGPIVLVNNILGTSEKGNNVGIRIDIPERGDLENPIVIDGNTFEANEAALELIEIEAIQIGQSAEGVGTGNFFFDNSSSVVMNLVPEVLEFFGNIVTGGSVGLDVSTTDRLPAEITVGNCEFTGQGTAAVKVDGDFVTSSLLVRDSLFGVTTLGEAEGNEIDVLIENGALVDLILTNNQFRNTIDTAVRVFKGIEAIDGVEIINNDFIDIENTALEFIGSSDLRLGGGVVKGNQFRGIAGTAIRVNEVNNLTIGGVLEGDGNVFDAITNAAVSMEETQNVLLIENRIFETGDGVELVNNANEGLFAPTLSNIELVGNSLRIEAVGIRERNGIAFIEIFANRGPALADGDLLPLECFRAENSIGRFLVDASDRIDVTIPVPAFARNLTAIFTETGVGSSEISFCQALDFPDRDGDGIPDAADPDPTNPNDIAIPAFRRDGRNAGNARVQFEAQDGGQVPVLRRFEGVEPEEALGGFGLGLPGEEIEIVGVFSFEAEVGVGETIRVTLEIPDGFEPNQVLKILPDGVGGFELLALNDAVFDQTIGTASFTVTDGGARDLDGLANGVIVDPFMLAMDPDAPLVPTIDSDTDGLPDGFEIQTFGSLAVSGANDDPDGDGQTTGQERVFGTDANLGSGRFKIEVNLVGEQVILSWSSKAGRTYQLQTGNLLDDFVPVGGPLPGTGNTINVVLDQSVSDTFFRVKASFAE